MKKITLLSISISILLTGCFNSWSKEEKQLLNQQATSMVDIFPMTDTKNKTKYIECFSNYVMDNYNFKEYMNSGSSAGLGAMTNCQKYIIK
jgi:hypothetical protein